MSDIIHLGPKTDLNELCLENPTACFFVRVAGDSMLEAGIFPNDILVIDRALVAAQGDIVLATYRGAFTVKELVLRPKLSLVPHNPNYPTVMITDGDDFEVFGVVSSVVRQLKGPFSA